MHSPGYKILLLCLIFLLPFSKSSFAQIPAGNPTCQPGDGINISLNDHAYMYLCGYGAGKPQVRIPIVSKIDTMGNVIWNYTFKRNKVGEVVSAYLEDTALYVVCKYDSLSLPDTYNILEVSKISTNTGKRLWRRNLFTANTYLSGARQYFEVVSVQERNAANIIILHNRHGGSGITNYFNTLSKNTGALTNTFVSNLRYQLVDFKIDSAFSFIYGVGTDTVYKLSAASPGSVIWKTKINNNKTEAKLFLNKDGVFIVTTAITPSYNRNAQVIKLYQSNGVIAWATLGNCFNVFVRDFTVKDNSLYVAWKPSTTGGGTYYIEAEKYNLLTGNSVWSAHHPLHDSGGTLFTSHILLHGNKVILTGMAHEVFYYQKVHHYWFNNTLTDSSGSEIYFNKTTLDSLDENFTTGIKSHIINNRVFHVGNFKARTQLSIYSQYIEYPQTNIGLVKLNNAGTQTYKRVIEFGTQPLIPPIVRTAICPGDTLWLSNKNLASTAAEWLLNNQHYAYAADTFAILTTASTIKLAVNNGTCTGNYIFPVTISPAVNLTVSANTSINYGSSVQLSASGAATYLWHPNVAISSQTSRNPTVNPATTTWYYVTGKNSQGCSKTDSVLVTVLNGPLGIKANADQAAFKVYPNPVRQSGLLTIETCRQEPCLLRLYNLQGKLMLEKQLQTSLAELDLKGLAAGVYNLHLTSDQLKPATFKLIVY